jgi:RHS repeat-associated protein
MRNRIVPVLALCALVTSSSVGRGQSGPDNDPDGAPGYVNSVFHHGQVDSVNMYNGQLTIPISLGPSYPVGPKLRVQVILTYNSRSVDYGAPTTQSSEFFYRPLVGNPSLGSGWELTLGAIKNCKHGTITGVCYFAADGSQHMFATGPKASDASQLYLSPTGSTGPYDMWDGDGNHYFFGNHVSGYDDVGLPEGYTHDFGRGRDGWYLSSVTDPYGNAYSISYYSTAEVSTPLWTYAPPPVPCATHAVMEMRAPGGTGTWIPKDISLPSGNRVHFNTTTVLGVSGMLGSVDFPEFVDGVPATRTWTIGYEATPATLTHDCGKDAHGNSMSVVPNVLRMKSVTLPADDSGAAPAYLFSSSSELSHVLLDQVTLPTGGAIQYCYANYTFFHGRGGKLQPGCPGMLPPADDPDNVVTESTLCPLAESEELAPDIPGGCTQTNSQRWIDHQPGVVRRREIVGSAQNDTVYRQFAFPFGEEGNASSPQSSQTLTIAVFPGTDRNNDAGRSRAKAVLFSSTRGPSSPTGELASLPGDVVGAELEERVFETDPTASALQDPPCGGGTDSGFCGSKAVRIVQKTYATDSSVEGLAGTNRRLISEKTIDGASTCGTCPYHRVDLGPTTDNTWDDNGRHYPVETHTGTLGGDARTVTTYWAPWHWNSGPPAGQPVLPNLLTRRTTTMGSSSKDEYYEFDTVTPNKYGFLKGTFVYDPGTYGSPGNTFSTIVFLNCRYDDGAGNVDKEFTATYPGLGYVPDHPCSTVYPTFPNPLPNNGDAFGKDYTWQHGELLSARWINGTAGTPTFNFRDYTRDASTGWITASRDTSGRSTSYQYDALGRVHKITPPSASELPTFVCYEGPGATTAYRASARQACPVASSNASIATWQHFEYDGLARLSREKRLQPSAAVVKRFTLYDGPGNAYFTSEWVPDATSQTIVQDLSASCAFSGGTLTGRGRPSAAPGTYRLCYDPFGRPQQIVGPKMSSLVVVDRTDGSGNVYSDTKEAALTYCVNAAFSNLATPSCASGGINATTTTKKDAFGRITSVTEPTGDVTSHTYDVNGKLLTVAQGNQQSRTFLYDDEGFLRKETTPEKGTVYYDSIGSLGDVLTEKQPDGLVISRTFDFAGRLAKEDAPAGTRYLVNCYDGAATCVDGSPGFAGGSYPGGKLTRRYGYNWIPTVGPVVDEQFTYSDGGGRLSQLTTTVGNGDLSAPTTQSWTYTNLGLLGTHNHPRASGSFPVVTTYTNGLPTGVSANATSLVTAAAYNPAAGIASWTSNTSPTAVVTTIVQDATMLPRPSQITVRRGSTPLFDTGIYAYDGAGNVLAESNPSDGGTFTYDSRSRILSSGYSIGSRSFAYDRWGNLLQNGSLSYPVDNTRNRLVVGGSTTSVAYDGRGNLTTHNADTMSYDALDRLYRNQSGASDFVFLHNGAGERFVRFPGNTSLARREMARLVGEANKAAGKTGWTGAPNACLGTFSDVPCSDADAGWIQTLYDHGTAAGCGSGNFCPNDTLNRAQMATFVVKGYRSDGAPAPACTGIFADVPCTGSSPWVPFAPYIEQLSRDNVTAGCGGNNFCPGNPVTPWQILVWMSKTPAVPGGGKTWASVYHPVPRGSIYTLRDEQNRVVTEMTDASSGSASATLSVQRDNVFFGNLLVASNSLGTWNYDVSDHLGSVRKLWNTSGTVTETHKYWPYGEDTNTTPPSQHLAFQTMERNDGVAQHFDHARTQHYNLGRFMSTDTARGQVTIPQSWNRYAYARNNPAKLVDPNGLWPTEVHNQIIDLAFRGLNDHQRLVLKAASVSMDACPTCQMKSHNHDHFMKSPGENPQAARQAAESLIKKEEGTAQRIQGPISSAADIGDESLKHFGMALHTVTDGTSPGHVDASGAPRDWNGLPISPSRAEAAREHAFDENHPTADQLNHAVREAQRAFCETYGDIACQQAVRPR